jgi:uncharacterized protein Smg (DUF494 family)
MLGAVRPRLNVRHRDALLAAILPAPGDGLPALAELDLGAFWPRFEAVAPVHLRLGLRVATLALGVALPLSLGYGRTLAALSEDEREAVITRALRLPGLSPLVDVAKLVACMAYFADPEVQATARRRT